MKQVETIYKKVKEALIRLPGHAELQTEFTVGAGARADFVVATKSGKNFVVEVKLGPPNIYLEMSSYPQLLMYRKLMESWHQLRNVVPVIITNRPISKDLADLLTQSGIATVELADSSEGIFLNLKSSLQRIGEWPEENGNLLSK